MVFLAIAALILFTYVNGDCNNPMFQYPIRMFGRQRIPMNLLDEPAPQPNFGSCQHLDGKSSCCNAATFQPFSQYFKGYDAEMQLGQQIMKTQTPAQIELLVERWGHLQLNDQQRVYMINLIALVQPTIDVMVQCNGGLLGYKQGMLCFGCHPDWTNYFDIVNNLMYLTKDTCESVNNECQDMFTQLTAIAVPVLDALIGVANYSTHPNEMLVAELVGYQNFVRITGSICEPLGYKNCKDLLCYGFLHGTVASLNLQPPPRLLKNANKKTLFGRHDTASDDDLALAAVLDPLKGLVKQLLGKNYKLQQSTNINRTLNCYGNGTYNYDAYNAGCECELSVLACPIPTKPASSSNQTLVIGVSVASVLALALIVVLIAYFLKRSSGQTDSHVPLEEEYEAPSNQRQLIEEASQSKTPDTSTTETGGSAYIAPSLVTSEGTING